MEILLTEEVFTEAVNSSAVKKDLNSSLKDIKGYYASVLKDAEALAKKLEAGLKKSEKASALVDLSSGALEFDSEERQPPEGMPRIRIAYKVKSDVDKSDRENIRALDDELRDIADSAKSGKYNSISVDVMKVYLRESDYVYFVLPSKGYTTGPVSVAEDLEYGDDDIEVSENVENMMAAIEADDQDAFDAAFKAEVSEHLNTQMTSRAMELAETTFSSAEAVEEGVDPDKAVEDDDSDDDKKSDDEGEE